MGGGFCDWVSFNPPLGQTWIMENNEASSGGGGGGGWGGSGGGYSTVLGVVGVWGGGLSWNLPLGAFGWDNL